MDNTITRIEAVPLRVPVEFARYGSARRRDCSLCHVEVETASGTVGYGLGYLADASVVAQLIDAVAAPAIMGEDAMATERVWKKLYWTLSAAAQSGYAVNVISAIDIALHDIRGKVLGQPLWRLLGGARDRLPIYATIGIPGLERDEMAEVARHLVSDGYRGLKIQVGRPGLGGEDPLIDIIAADIDRIAGIREAVGDDIELSIDGSCRFDLPHALELARRAEPYNISWYEEPLMQNDALLLADMRRRTPIKLAGGQNEGQLYRFRDLIVHQAIDVVQPNVVVSGGFSQSVRIANLAAAFNLPITNGGGCPYHNAHLHAGLWNGGALEYQTSSAGACEIVYEGLPQPRDGWMTLSETPGLGFSPRPGVIAQLRV